MLIHPHFDPIAIKFGTFNLPLVGSFSPSIRWYGLMYLIAFVLFLALGNYRIRKQPSSGWTKTQLDDLLFYGVLGVILGGRLGYVLFYKPGFYFNNFLDAFKIWEGGMAFHGGFLGVLVAMWWYGRKTQRSFFQVSDFVAPLVPLGLAAGRLGNFINGELWGRVTNPDAPWAMLFRGSDVLAEDQLAAQTNPEYYTWLQTYGGLPRHPSQLYQFALEGLLLFIVLWIYSSKPRRTGQVSALFLTGYGICRFIAEFAREPDNFLGLLGFGLSMGQWLSLPMILAGGWMMFRFSRAK